MLKSVINYKLVQFLIKLSIEKLCRLIGWKGEMSGKTITSHDESEGQGWKTSGCCSYYVEQQFMNLDAFLRMLLNKCQF